MFEIFGRKVEPGQKVFDYCHVGYLAGNTECRIGYGVFNGVKEGPVLTLISALHGWEPMGTEIIRRTFLDVDPKDLSGTVVVIPIANPFSMEFGGTAESSGLQINPADSLNLNRVFPGRGGSGWLTEQLAHLYTEEISRVSDVVLDYHDGTSSNNMIPLVTFLAYEPELGYQADLAARTETLAKAMGAQVGRRIEGDAPDSGNISAALGIRGVPTMMLSVAGLGQVDENVDEGIRCTKNLMKAMGILEGEVDRPEYQLYCSGPQHKVLLTTAGGFFYPAPGATLGAWVQQGQEIGVILDPLTSEVRETLRAPFKGILGMFRGKMVTNPGGMVGHLANLEDYYWSLGTLPGSEDSSLV